MIARISPRFHSKRGATGNMARLKTYTLGCKVNQYETELVREALEKHGYQSLQHHQAEPADLCVINTCTVTHEGDAKSRSVIRRMARQNPDAPIVVMGCYATRSPEEISVLPNVAEVVTDKRELPDVFGRFGVMDFPDGISPLQQPTASLCQSSGWVSIKVQLLHYPPSSSSDGKSSDGRNPARGGKTLCKTATEKLY